MSEEEGDMVRSTDKIAYVQPATQMAFDSMIEENAADAIEEVTEEGTAIAVFANPTTLTADDVTIPRLRLAQGLTKEVQDGNAKPGEFLLSGAAPRHEVTATVLAIAKFRRLTNGDDGSVLCRSEDGYLGVGDPGGDCESCPLSKWINAPEGSGKKNTPPQCQFGYRYLLDVADYGQCVFEMKRTSIPAAKALNAMVIRFGYGKTRVTIKAQKGTGSRGTYYTPVVVPVAAR